MNEEQREAVAKLTAERLALEEATRKAHETAQELRDATRAAQDEIKAISKQQAHRHLAKALEQAAEIVRKNG